MKAEEIKAIFKKYQFRFGDEADLQVEIAKMLTAHNVNFIREARLDERSRPDFAITHAPFTEDNLPLGMLLMEVKVGGQEFEILQQLERYAKDYRVNELIVASSKRLKWEEVFLIQGKPVHYIRVARRFLQ